MDIVKVSIMGICGMMLGFILKETRPEFAAICKDAGYQMIGTQIDLFCKLSVMVLSMPVLLAILDTISEFMI